MERIHREGKGRHKVIKKTDVPQFFMNPWLCVKKEECTTCLVNSMTEAEKKNGVTVTSCFLLEIISRGIDTALGSGG